MTLYPAIQVDLNSDGIPDWIAEDHSFQLVELLSSGSGNYNSATLSRSSGYGSYPIASGDFNGDGKADVIFAQPLGIAYGNGDGTLGTFQQIPFPNNVNYGQAQVADFNGDGEPDLALAFDTNFGPDGSPAFEVLLFTNNGMGFDPPVTIYNQDVPGGSNIGFEYSTDLDLVQGNFDTSGHADLALRTTESDPNNPAQADVNITILFGDGAGNFTPKPIYSGSNLYQISAADMNNDADSDIVANSSQPAIFYIHPNWTWDVSNLTAQYDTQFAGAITPLLGDFDGDGIKDVLYPAYDPNVKNNLGVSLLLQPSIGSFTQVPYFPLDEYNTLDGGVPFNQLFIGSYDLNAQPDAAIFTSAAVVNHPNSVNVILDPMPARNTCRLLASASGINVCSPAPGATVTGPVQFSFTANSFDPLRKMEVWIDGVKQSETYDVFGNVGIGNVTLNLSSGPHQVDLFAGNFDGTVQHTGYQITVR